MRVATTTASGPVALLDPPASNPENSHPEWTKPWGPVTRKMSDMLARRTMLRTPDDIV